MTIVTYNPEQKLLYNNISALRKQFDNVLIVDNGSKNLTEITRLSREFGHVDVIPLNKNKGIAFALNTGLKVAQKNRFDWILTMDQDSIIPDNLTTCYEHILKEYNNIGLLGWLSKNNNGYNPKNVYFLITSGCLTNVKAATEVGGWDNDLFVHQVDFDFSLKIHREYKVMATDNVKLYHELGKKTEIKDSNYSQFRDHSSSAYYYIIRNCIVLFKRYFFTYPFLSIQYFFIAPFYDFHYHMKFNRHNRKIDCIILWRAVIDGLRNNLGEMK